MKRLKAFGALQDAFGTLDGSEWNLLKLYYVDGSMWAVVAEALGVSERQAQRRLEEIREKLRRELEARGIGGAPPEGWPPAARA